MAVKIVGDYQLPTQREPQLVDFQEILSRN